MVAYRSVKIFKTQRRRGLARTGRNQIRFETGYLPLGTCHWGIEEAVRAWSASRESRDGFEAIDGFVFKRRGAEAWRGGAATKAGVWRWVSSVECRVSGGALIGRVAISGQRSAEEPW